MFRVRPVGHQDLDALLRMAVEASVGMTSLIDDKTMLKTIIADAQTCFTHPLPVRKKAKFLWVLEDLATKEVIGCSAVSPSIGGEQPFYSLMCQHQKVRSDHLGFTREDEWLIAAAEFPAATELASLYIHKNHRHQYLALLLSYARLLFIANFPKYFHSLIIAEVRGVNDIDGHSPFWEGLGRHFFHMNFAKADKLCWQQGTSFIQELMPKTPILKALLPRSAQNVMGHAHHDAQGALHLLLHQGLSQSPYIDLFDGGPLIWTDTSHMPIVHKSLFAKVHIDKVKVDKPAWLVREASLMLSLIHI